MLPATRSGGAEVLARLAELRARFHTWLHQDEFGPTRAEQIAALRAVIKLAGKLCVRLEKGSARSRDRLDAALRDASEQSDPLTAFVSSAATQVVSNLLQASASGAQTIWLSQLNTCAENLLKHLHLLDDTTADQIDDMGQRFELKQTSTSKEFGLADAERWLHRYRDLLRETLQTLTAKRGGKGRDSLKLLVEELCTLWEFETGLLVAAHGVVRDTYTSRAETNAGRFVTSAVETMLPDRSWFDEHAKFARSVRAETFLPDEPGKDRHRKSLARQVLVIMRNYVARRSRPRKVPKP
jgi:hypothetical protein